MPKTKPNETKASAPSGRPPVIAVMGHIDHGKSTLLDYIRQTNVVAGEVGGITQAVSAYEVIHKGNKITFLDTPGHEAFAGIRERGAKIADIAILVVSAEDGVKPQTIEAYKAIHEAGIPFVVAINKIDKANANIERTKQELAENEILVESYGGQVPAAEISAKTGTGVPELLDLLLLVAEVSELKGSAQSPAMGFVLEANLDAKTGISATLIIKNGTLRQGDWLVIENAVTKVKILRDFQGQPAKELSFSAPAQVIGFAVRPQVGASFSTFSDKKLAEKAAALAQAQKQSLQAKAVPSSGAGSTAQTEVALVIKADNVGSAEAVERELKKLTDDRVELKLLYIEVGAITENDIKLASGSANAIVLGFNVKADRAALDLAEKLQVPVQIFDIIYKLSEWLEEEVAKRRPKIEVEETLGRAKILKLFSGGKGKQVLGGVVTTGLIQPNKPFKVIRRESEIGRGKIIELQEQKLAAKEVIQDHQFGAMIESKIGIAAGDYLEVFETVTK